MRANKWLILSCYYYIVILETILLSANKWLIINSCENYFKPFNSVPKMSTGSLKKLIFKMSENNTSLVHIPKVDLALNIQQYLICHKTQANQNKQWWYAILQHRHWILTRRYFSTIHILIWSDYSIWTSIALIEAIISHLKEKSRIYRPEIKSESNHSDDLAFFFFSNGHDQTESVLHSHKQAARGIVFYETLSKSDNVF